MARALVIDPAAVARATARQPSDASGLVQTVTGPIAAARLGLTLMHEHVLVDFIGADQVSPQRYDANHAFTTVLPHLLQARQHGCATLVECTPAYLGRDVTLLKRLSEASGLHILSNTGYYGAAKDKHLPRFAFTESAEQLAARWTREFEQGIDGTSIKPAFMKIGVDEAPLSDVDRKLVRAAAITSRSHRADDRLSHGHGPGCHGGARGAGGGSVFRRPGSSGCTRRTSAMPHSIRAPRRRAHGSSSTGSPRPASPGTSNWSCR